MKLLAVRSLLAVLPLTLIPAFSAPAQEKPKPPADKSGATVERRSLFILQDGKPPVGADGGEQPPGPVMSEQALEKVPHSTDSLIYTRMDGKKASMALIFTRWVERKNAAGKREYAAEAHWIVKHPSGMESGRPVILADLQLRPPDEERLRRSLWKSHYRKRAHVNSEAAKKAHHDTEAEKFGAAIREYGKRPLAQESMEKLRLPGPEDLGNLPGLRDPVPVKLVNPSPSGRSGGKMRIVDWGMRPPDDYGNFPVLIRWEDGLEEEVKNFEISVQVPVRIRNQNFPKVNILEGYLLYFKDWAWLQQQPEEISGEENKVKTLKVLLSQWWHFTADQRKQLAEQTNQASAAELAELRKPMRYGARLKFPGLPPEGFKPWDDAGLDRSVIPVQDMEKFYTRNDKNSSGFGSFIAFLLWWDAAGKLEIPQSGNADRKTKWLYSALTRGNKDVIDGLNHYSREQLKGSVIFQTTKDYDCTPENMARYVKGGNAVLLTMSGWQGPRPSFGITMPVVDLQPDGSCALICWGKTIRGQWRKVDLPGVRPEHFAKDVPKQCWELEVENKEDLPEYFRQMNRRLILGDATWNTIAVVVPHLNDSAPPVKKK